jgi:hypothetical protein
MHTFPAYDPDKTKWVASTCAHCPRTVKLLKQLPTIRTALFSKLGPGTQVRPYAIHAQCAADSSHVATFTQLSSHTGWADLANYVLRSHLCLDIPTDGTCGLVVDGEVRFRVLWAPLACNIA